MIILPDGHIDISRCGELQTLLWMITPKNRQAMEPLLVHRHYETGRRHIDMAGMSEEEKEVLDHVVALYGPCFPERMRHKAVMEILSRLSPAIGSCGACFGGGTYCSLICGEYRRSDDIDFLCSDPEGYSRLRTLVGEGFFDGIPVLRIRDDRYAIRCLLAFEGMKIKFEIVAETDVNVTPVHDERFPVPVMDPLELAAVKPLANADRWHDQAMNSRDFLDFGMLLHTHTPQPEDVLEKIAERHFPSSSAGSRELSACWRTRLFSAKSYPTWKCAWRT